MVLNNSQYPDYFPTLFDWDYNSGTKIIVVDYQFPPIDKLPTLKEVKYIKSRDDFTEKNVTEKQLDDIYDRLLYQITLRTIHELYEADEIGALDCVVFNGIVASIDPATGKEVEACVLSLKAQRTSS